MELEPLLSVKDICARYQFKDPRTARKIMREMDHIERPALMVSLRAVKAWESKQAMPPASEVRRMLKRKGA